jgi:hypothetical protein
MAGIRNPAQKQKSTAGVGIKIGAGIGRPTVAGTQRALPAQPTTVSRGDEDQ